MSSKLSSNTVSLQAILETVNNLPEAGEGGTPSLQDKTVTPTTNIQIVTADSAYDGLDTVTVEAIPSDYIVTTDATAEAGEIMEGETAYVNGSKVTGTFTIDDELTTQDDLIAQIATALEGKAAGGGIDTSDATATSDEIFEGETAYAGGQKITGTFTINAELTAQEDLIAQIQSAVDNLPDAGSAEPVLQTKTITPAASSQTVVADSGYDGLSEVIVEGDLNLVAENIKSGISIFGVSGTHVGDSDGDSVASELFDQMVEGTLVNCVNSTVSQVRSYAFENLTTLQSVDFSSCSWIGQEAFGSCASLKTAIFPACISMASSAFAKCTKLTSISFPQCVSVYWAGFSSCSALTTVDLPACTYLGGRAFQYCTKLASISLPLCKYIYSSTFQSCSALTTMSLPNITIIGSTAFGNCTNLSTFYLAGSTLCTLSGSNAFTGTGITSTTGSIYVNASLVDSYKTATNWTYFSNIIYAIE